MSEAESPNALPEGLSAELLATLICPATRTPLVFDADKGGLVSEAAGLVYPIENGIVHLDAESAKPID